MTKAIHFNFFKWNGVIVWRRDYRIIAVKSFPPGTPWQFSRDYLVPPQDWVTPPPPQTKGGAHRLGSRNHQRQRKRKVCNLKEKKEQKLLRFPLLGLKRQCEMYSCEESCFMSHFSCHSCQFSPADSAIQLLFVSPFFANPRQDAAVHDWESDLSPSAKWMTKINIKKTIVFGQKRPFCPSEASDFLLEALSWNAQMWPSKSLSCMSLFFKNWYMPYVQESRNSTFYWPQLHDKYKCSTGKAD